jgi:hypothetical protein
VASRKNGIQYQAVRQAGRGTPYQQVAYAIQTRDEILAIQGDNRGAQLAEIVD